MRQRWDRGEPGEAMDFHWRDGERVAGIAVAAVVVAIYLWVACEASVRTPAPVALGDK